MNKSNQRDSALAIPIFVSLVGDGASTSRKRAVIAHKSGRPMVAPTEYKKHIVGATIGRPSLFAEILSFSRDVVGAVPYRKTMVFL